MKYIFLFLIRLYQTFISPLLGPRCRFYPSCSQYALECFQHYGFFKALFKSIWRILRCNPFSEGYFDPAVPEKEADANQAHAHAHCRDHGHAHEHTHEPGHSHQHSIAGGHEH